MYTVSIGGEYIWTMETDWAQPDRLLRLLGGYVQPVRSRDSADMHEKIIFNNFQPGPTEPTGD